MQNHLTGVAYSSDANDVLTGTNCHGDESGRYPSLDVSFIRRTASSDDEAVPYRVKSNLKKHPMMVWAKTFIALLLPTLSAPFSVVVTGRGVIASTRVEKSGGGIGGGRASVASRADGRRESESARDGVGVRVSHHGLAILATVRAPVGSEKGVGEPGLVGGVILVLVVDRLEILPRVAELGDDLVSLSDFLFLLLGGHGPA